MGERKAIKISAVQATVLRKKSDDRLIDDAKKLLVTHAKLLSKNIGLNIVALLIDCHKSIKKGTRRCPLFYAILLLRTGCLTSYAHVSNIACTVINVNKDFRRIWNCCGACERSDESASASCRGYGNRSWIL